MKLFKKEGRRYTEVSDGEVLRAAAEVLSRRGMYGTAQRIEGMADLILADEENALQREIRTRTLAEEAP